MNMIQQADKVWHRKVWAMAGPIILSNLTVPLVGAVDTAVIGQLDNPSLIAAVAIGSVLFGFIYWAFGFLRMGTTGFVAQAHGQNDNTEVLYWFLRAVLLALVCGALLIMLQVPIAAVGFKFVEGSAEFKSNAAVYYQIRIWSAPATLINYALLGVLIGTHAAKQALYLQLILNLSNVILDLVFVGLLDFGVAGVAYATLISEYLAVTLGLWLVLKRLPGFASIQRSRFFDLEKYSTLLQVNLSIFIRTLCLIFTFYYFAIVGSRFGELVLAANAVLLHFMEFSAYGLDALAHAAEALAGSAYGARNKKAFLRAVNISTFWALLVTVLIMLIFWTCGEYFIDLMTVSTELREICYEFLPWVVVLPILSVWSYQLDGVFIGATRHKEMRNAMIISFAGYLLLVNALAPEFGNHGLWLSLALFQVFRGVTMGWYYRGIVQGFNGKEVG